MQLTRARVLSRRCLFQARRSASKGARKDDRFWKLERVRTGAELRKVLLNSLMSWRSTLGRIEVSSPSRAASRAVRRVKPPSVDPLFAEYVAGMDDDLQDWMLVPDDKGKNHGMVGFSSTVLPECLQPFL